MIICKYIIIHNVSQSTWPVCDYDWQLKLATVMEYLGETEEQWSALPTVAPTTLQQARGQLLDTQVCFIYSQYRATSILLYVFLIFLFWLPLNKALPAKQTKLHVLSIPLGLLCGSKILFIVKDNKTWWGYFVTLSFNCCTNQEFDHYHLISQWQSTGYGHLQTATMVTN